MDLSLLRGFAAGVRVELVGVVGARLAGVLLPGSVERVEFPEAVRRLEGVIARLGRDVVVDQVAYTWFNRLVALRFMDVNGYTGVGVVSPAGGAVTGQPEVLADAKAGHVDAGVVGEKVRDRVIGLLSGSVVSRDGQGEAYKLLLAAYCNRWAGPMPFMFERSGDFTELLVPDDLLSERSIVARVVRTLTPEACADVEVIGWLYQFYIAARKDEVFAGFKKNKKATALEIPAATQLFTPHWIVKYLVENSLGRLWLLNNPGSELASRMEYYIAPVEPETDFLRISGPEELKVLDPACGSGHMLTYAFDLLFLMYEEAGYAPSDIPGLILKHNLFGAEIDPRAGALAAFALVMKARGRQKSFLNPGKGAEPNICVLEPVHLTADELDTLLTRGGDKHAETVFWQAFEEADTFGSLIRPNQDLIEPLKAHVESLGEAQTLFGGDVLERAGKVIRQSEYLSTRYHVVVANPPYMGSGNMGPKLAEFAKREYPDSKSDLFAMFVERGLEFAQTSAYSAMVTMQSWMFLSSYRELREKLLLAATLQCLVHMDNMVMGIAFGTAASVWTKSAVPSLLADFQFVTLRDLDGGAPRVFPVANERASQKRSSDFDAIPGKPIAYWLPPAVMRAFVDFPPLSDHIVVTGGMTTGNNDRFLRRWFEVSERDSLTNATNETQALLSGKKWFPYNKGGEYRKWFGNREYYVNWMNSGADILDTGRAYPRSRKFYFRPSLTYTATSSSYFGIRYSEQGAIFDAKGSSCFASEDEIFGLLGYLASKPVTYLLKAINPTIEFQTGDILRLPHITCGNEKYARDLVQLSRDDLALDEVDRSFRSPGLLISPDRNRSVRSAVDEYAQFSDQLTSTYLDLEQRNNAAVAQALQLDGSIDIEVARHEVTLSCNPAFNLGKNSTETERNDFVLRRSIQDLVSYSVGCMFGRYSLDIPGLVLANQGDTLAEYLAMVPSPSFMPDKDNVLPVLSDAWFEDDIVERFRAFLKASFGEEYFEENLRFVEESLGKDIRKYFVQDFYKDHVRRYKKRPIYWLFSSPKGSFNALIYMHRYRPDTVSVVLNDYLHEFQAKLRARRLHVDQVASSALSSVKEQTVARKESEQIGKVLLELEEWEQNVLYPLATEQIEIDLDDGVKVNYPKFGAALKKIVGLEANE
ncbi:BREX-1 system adenine-specific DNA-methyltransferase PglX [Arthrobacter sp. IA7]|uniref:BREX-1 system adenine-specific DNA-methyltransferase PglX n=1 Tax=Arthrobacter ipis TaxID=2716202 RepID=UPI00168285E8|nr:BREX-1 system adenine-specific DNA-methyltransferase PglX [Arthrobacter ipis]MBD1543938.1 BREX-1 system adenine-specific DNA-methyltransferase PglX [Arthrobacter ipis]